MFVMLFTGDYTRTGYLRFQDSYSWSQETWKPCKL